MKEPDKLFSQYVSWRGDNVYRFCACYIQAETKTRPAKRTSKEMETTRSVLIAMVKEIMTALQQEEYSTKRKQGGGGS